MTKYGELLTDKEEWSTSAFAVWEIKQYSRFKYLCKTKQYEYFIKGHIMYRTKIEPELLGGGSRIQLNWSSLEPETYLLGYTDDTRVICINEETGGYFYVHRDKSNSGISITDIAKYAGIEVEAIAILTRKEA